jgi:hypothetical protein
LNQFSYSFLPTQSTACLENYKIWLTQQQKSFFVAHMEGGVSLWHTSPPSLRVSRVISHGEKEHPHIIQSLAFFCFHLMLLCVKNKYKFE